MTKPIPLTWLGSVPQSELDNFNLDNFFGFMDITIECPDSILNPILPASTMGQNLYPRGVISGTYFSEEVKDAIRIGYKLISVKSAQRFSSEVVFKDFVDEMYSIKSVSTGPERWIAKLLLNTLYGTFGRRQESLNCIVINNCDLDKYLVAFNIQSEITIDSDRTMLLLDGEVNYQVLNGLNVEYDVPNSVNLVKANVGIASAITSYARIYMNQFKQSEALMYSDTDSLITLEPLSG